jgi:hypothetical protein
MRTLQNEEVGFRFTHDAPPYETHLVVVVAVFAVVALLLFFRCVFIFLDRRIDALAKKQ